MTPHEKVIYIIQQLELSDSKVARAIQKSTSAATHKRMRLRDNKFTDDDYQNIRAFYLEKLRSIENLDVKNTP
ncbi:hypothetical protein [Capnocytophaga leadbetteri]|uniref:hypothetical protein n=1 Tax=Capnocytophaga leadbetteri TaxID=327575 RepID=UPI0028E3B4F2|nr:hypothetical protein [Capnocytophaga leadbetteri]